MAEWLDSLCGTYDFTILNYFHNLQLSSGKILTPIAKALSITCDLPLLLIGWLGFILFFVLKDKKCGMLMCGSVIIGAILVTIILKNVVYRPRPYINSETYKTWWSVFNLKEDWDTSFPSGHACAAMAGVTAFFIWSKKKYVAWLAYIYPFLVGASRLYLCVHYPSDVLAGYIVGVISALLCIPCVKIIYTLINKYPDNFFSRYCLTGSIFKNKNKQG